MKRNVVLLLSFLISLSLLLSGCGLQSEGSQAQVVDPSPSPADVMVTPEAQPETAPELWTLVKDIPPVPQRTNYEGFITEDFGITVGFSGDSQVTSDGGKTWTKGENESMCRFGLDIVDQNIAWSCGNSSQVRVTRDGGKTWSAVTDFPITGKQYHISFLDDKTGWVAALRKLCATNDGGMTWQDVALPEGVNAIGSVHLRTPLDGYLLSLDGRFFATSDGGATWQEKKNLDFAALNLVDLDNKPGLLPHNPSFPVADINFTDESHGVVAFVGLVPKVGMKVWTMKTSDGGMSWTTYELNPGDNFSASNVYLSKDGQLLTLSSTKKQILIYKSVQ